MQGITVSHNSRKQDNCSPNRGRKAQPAKAVKRKLFQLEVIRCIVNLSSDQIVQQCQKIMMKARK